MVDAPRALPLTVVPPHDQWPEDRQPTESIVSIDPWQQKMNKILEGRNAVTRLRIAEYMDVKGEQCIVFNIFANDMVLESSAAMAKKTEHKYGTDKRGIERWLGRADRLWDPAYTSTEFGNAIAIMTEGFDIAVAKDDCLSGVLLSDVIDTSYFEAWGVYFRMQGGWLPCQLS